jgi:hypothetical protein
VISDVAWSLSDARLVPDVFDKGRNKRSISKKLSGNLWNKGNLENRGDVNINNQSENDAGFCVTFFLLGSRSNSLTFWKLHRSSKYCK